MNNDEKKLVERLGEFITVENIYKRIFKPITKMLQSSNGTDLKKKIIFLEKIK